MDIRLRRVYEPMSDDDGMRVLVDRLWPRGVAKANLPGVAWLKAIAPSDALRKSFAHQPGKYDAFRRRYFVELDANADAVNSLRALAGQGRVTLLYAARDETHNNATALREYLEEEA